MKKRHFFKEGIKDIKTTGSLLRSSKHLCLKMIENIDFSVPNVIVELGAGDGVITEHILKKMHPESKLLSFEINPKFCDVIRSRFDDPRLILIEDSAEKVGHYLAENGAPDGADYVVSALPFVMLPDDLGVRVVSACKEHMKKGALFNQMHYSLVKKKLYKGIFGNVRIKLAPFNLPPAFVLVSVKE